MAKWTCVLGPKFVSQHEGNMSTQTLAHSFLRNLLSKCHGQRGRGMFTVTEWLANGWGQSLEGENMKRLLLVALLVLAAASVAWAQDDRTISSQVNANAAADFANTSAALASPKLSGAISWPLAELRPANATSLPEPRSSAAPAEAVPAAPEPKYVYGSRDDFRWQLALGVSVLRFRSSIFYATGVGTNTSVTYFTNEWFGVEGSIITAFAPTVYLNEHVKYFSYGAGPKIAWRARKWEPWAHTVIGGVHIQPQTAGNSSSGFGLQVGGGADYRIFPHLSARVGLDWLRTHLFGEWQNSAQANADIVLHF
jgi:opacity protein-like surface antigen